MYVCVTHVDAVTRRLCTVAPMRNGPDFPKLPGLLVEFANESQYPILANERGIYTAMPLFWARCYDSAITENVPGLIAVLTEEEYHQAKLDEFIARRPYPSWIWGEELFRWDPPIPDPGNRGDYYWDEEAGNWIPTFVPEPTLVEEVEPLAITTEE